MSGTHGIKETKEALIGLNEVTILIANRLKDGAQAADIPALLEDMKKDPEVVAKLAAARDNIKEVPAEIKDLQLAEGLELGVVQASYVPKLIAAMKKA